MKTWWRNVGLIGLIVTYSFLSFTTSELELWQACVEGDENQVVRILRRKNHLVDPNYCHPDGTTPLWQAVEQGNAKIVSLLLAKGALPERLVVEQLHHGHKKPSGKEGLNSLGQSEGVREEHRKRNWIRSKLKKTRSAGKLGVKELAPFSKDIKAKTDTQGVGLIALHLAVLRHQHHIIPILLNDDEGEQLLLCTQEGENSFHMACRAACFECLQALLRPFWEQECPFLLPAINQLSKEGIAPVHELMRRLRQENLPFLALLLENQADPALMSRIEQPESHDSPREPWTAISWAQNARHHNSLGLMLLVKKGNFSQKVLRSYFAEIIAQLNVQENPWAQIKNQAPSHPKSVVEVATIVLNLQRKEGRYFLPTVSGPSPR